MEPKYVVAPSVNADEVTEFLAAYYELGWAVAAMTTDVNGTPLFVLERLSDSLVLPAE